MNILLEVDLPTTANTAGFRLGHHNHRRVPQNYLKNDTLELTHNLKDIVTRLSTSIVS